jgi:uroporphyrinogen-III decarboxylase
MLSRRQFVSVAAASAALGCARVPFANSATLGHKERVDRTLLGQKVDRPPYSLWHHFNKPTPQEEARSLVEFHRRYDTDIVKAMNDFDYPRSATGKWYEISPIDSPYPQQLETLELVREGLNGDAYFIDTLFGPYFTAQLLLGAEPEYADRKLSENQVLDETSVGLRAFQKRSPQAWHDMMGAITESTINHIHKAKKIGTSGALVSIMNATEKFNSIEDYERYSRPYDRRIMDALSDSRLTMLHLHFLDASFIPQFRDFNTPVVNYSVRTSGIPMSTMRANFTQTLAGGVDEIDYDSLSVAEMRRQWTTASKQAGPKYIVTPGCALPKTSTPQALARLRQSLTA